MCAIDVKTAISGFLNNRFEFDSEENIVTFEYSDIERFVRDTWNAGCGPIISDFDEKDLCFYLDSSKFFKKVGDKKYCVNMNQFAVDPSVAKALKSEHNSRRFVLFYQLGARINYPYLLMKYMGFGCFYDLK